MCALFDLTWIYPSLMGAENHGVLLYNIANFFLWNSNTNRYVDCFVILIEFNVDNCYSNECYEHKEIWRVDPVPNDVLFWDYLIIGYFWAFTFCQFVVVQLRLGYNLCLSKKNQTKLYKSSIFSLGSIIRPVTYTWIIKLFIIE